MASIGGFLKSCANAVRAVASATVGIPLALATTVVVGTAALTTSAMNYCWSHVVKKSAFAKELHFDKSLDSLQKSMWGFLGATWTQLGLYTYIEACKKVGGYCDGRAAALGQDDRKNSSAYIAPPMENSHEEKQHSGGANQEPPPAYGHEAPPASTHLTEWERLQALQQGKQIS